MRAATIKIARFIIGFAFALMSGGFLIDGGLSRFARIGIPAHPDWRSAVIGLVLLGIAVVVLPRRPRAPHPR